MRKKNNQTNLLVCLFLLVCLLIVSLNTKADGSADYFRNASNFSWMVCGDAEIEFSIPVFIWDSSSNDAVTSGYIYVTPGDESETQLLYYAYDSSRDQDKPTTFMAKADGEFSVTNTTNGTASFTRNDGSRSWTLKRDVDDDDHHTAKIRWKVPYQWCGKTIQIRVKFRWDSRHNGGELEYKLSPYECPNSSEASITLNDPMLAFDKSSAGYIMIPWYAQVKSLSDTKLRMVDAANDHVSISKVESSKNLSGYVNIPMDRPYSSVVMSGEAVAMNGKVIPGRLESNSIEVPMLHTPTGMTASMKPDGKVVVGWKIDLPNTYDIMDNDMFEVQRNMTGSTNPDDAEWTTIALEQYERTKGYYEVIDSSMLDRYEGKPVTYRVRRQCTSVWGWVPAAKYTQVQIPANIALYGINNAMVTRSSIWNDDEHYVDFSFNMSGPEYDNENRFIIRSAADWERFAAMVNGGQNNLNVILGGDIDLGDSQTMVGTQDNPYYGTFDGNGHTLTVNYKSTQEYTAPFRYAQRATFKNLRVAGTISSSAQFCGGIVGVAGASLYSYFNIEFHNCQSSVTLDSSVDGNATNGGFVAHVINKGSISFDNCLFDGSFTGDYCHSNGGFVGWIDEAINNPRFKNCYFNPTQISTKQANCRTFARYNTDKIELDLINCYYSELYDGSETTTIDGKEFFIICNAVDWIAFKNKVEASNGDVNAILNADITITESIGTEAHPYSGLFKGNGHTINCNIDASKGGAPAPFAYAGSATIHDLHIAGSIRGDNPAGLVKSVRTSGNFNVIHVRVSANITDTSKNCKASGFIQNAGSSNAHMSNCLFDGTITASNSNDSYAAPFICYSDATTADNWTIYRCYENGAYNNISNLQMAFYVFYIVGSMTAIQPYACDNTNYSTHDWSTVNSNNRNAGKLSNQTLITKLGGNWTEEGGMVVPKMEAKSIGQGNTTMNFSDADLLSKLGDKWQIAGSTLVPQFERTEGSLYGSTVWDKRAKMQLRINMHGEKGVESKIVDLSDNKEALEKHQFRQELTRKCVDYSFDLLIIRAKSPLKIAGFEKDTAVYAVSKTETGDLANYRFQNGNRITKLEAAKKQSSVELKWATTGGDHDFFRVLRRKHTNQADAAWTDTIATNLDLLSYEDKTVLVQQVYDYRVESVYQCEGTNIESMTCTGACETTGMIEGYLRLADGTALAGDTVYCEPVKGVTIPGADAYYKTISDDTGYYVFRGLPFQVDANGNTNGNYRVWVATPGDRGSYTSPNGQADGIVNFGQNSNWSKDFNFYMDTYYVLSGNVYYRDTSMPVSGASFKLDGELIHDASQHLITTDTQGAFTLSIPKGKHKVQVVKKGHKFANDGFLENHDATDPEQRFDYNFNTNVAGVCFWDSTTVMLRGRVVGGDVQGSKPFGKSLSKNNLGDSIKIVMQLEGDNVSYLIRKQDDETVKSASYKNVFGAAEGDTTRVDVTRHTLTIRPDAKTGEYQVMLHPAKYKVIEVSGEGYATLFQQGKVGETVDLSFNVMGDTCEYSRIYHAEPTVEVTQYNAGGEKYFGVKKLTANDNIGNKAEMTIWYQQKNKEDATRVDDIYAFGYPVFMAGSPYGWILQACEKYYWNNKINGEADIVNLSGGKVKIQNALTTDSKTAQWECDLDEQGGASYIFTPDNTTFTMEGDHALKSVSITLEYDNSFFDIKPFNGKILQGYVMATRAKAQGRKAVVAGIPQLFDILRDPPGGGSSAYIDAGTKLSYGYNWELAATVGFSLKSKTGEAKTIYMGQVLVPATGAVGSSAGDVSTHKVENGLNLHFETNFDMSWTYNYNMDVTERIQTSSGKKWVGSKADIFIGTTENVVFEDAMAVRVIPDSMYQIVKQHGGGTFEMTDKDGNTGKIKVPDGTTKVLATGTDITGKPVYLVRDEVMQIYPQVKSTFVHTQFYIENELLPDLMKIRNSLLLPKGTADSYARELANQRGYTTYVSTVDANDENYGLKGSYKPFYPEGQTLKNDSISALNQEMYAWISMLAKNEQEKLSVLDRNLVKRYDFDGAANIQYSENFSTVTNGSRYLRYPLLSGFGNLGVLGGVFEPLMKTIEAAMTSGKATTTTRPNNTVDEDSNETTKVSMEFGTSTTEIAFMPIVSVNFNDKFTTSETYSKKTGFTLSASSKSSLMVDVYRTETQYTYNKDQNQFYQLTEDVLDDVRNGRLGSTGGLSWVQDTTAVYSNFVFRTRAGVTCEPYEGERVTKWYQPGTVLDAATIPADKPRIWIDEPVVSNVPFDEPARFTLHLANESDYPEQASLIFNYYLLGSSNPNGAKVLIDGTPMNSQGVNLIMYPCRDKNNEVSVFTKQIEVWAGKEFDYNDLTLCLYDPEDASRVFECKFSAHFVPTAGKVNVSSPSYNWVMNTDSPYDGKQESWYMPVRIDGFDTNYRGFDHIELQYKLTTQGDKDWVNVCSYYNDKELMAKSSGVTDTIPSDGIIVARFYGETNPREIEQRYDLRAVSYCRHGNGFLTGSSPILTGIKDTRRPVAFGTPEPTNGILGIGDDIKIKFSEPIAGNYLSEINNFEVLGTRLSDDITTSTALSFDGNAVATTQGERNLKGKSFTVDIMLNPAIDKREMTVFSHGDDAKNMRFGLTADRKLSATINGETVESDATVSFNNMLHQVAYVLDQSGENTTVKFFDGSKPIGSKQLSKRYEGASSGLVLGTDFNYTRDILYKGEMLEFRLWNRAMTGGELSSYSQKKLTGYETGLLDYYPLNEGEGNWGYDKAPGSMDLMLSGTSWKRPAGIAMEIKGNKGLRLKPEKFTRTKDHDYTLTFWFRTNDENATLFSNGEAKKDQEDQLNIGVKGRKLYVRSQGFERKTSALVSEGSWHHFAMTVSRSQNVSNVYVDKTLVESFPADSIGGIVGDHIALGATYVDKNTPTNVMKGHIDEVGMYESVLPLNLIKEFSNHTPIATMTALKAYLDFGRSEKMDDNTQHLEPTGISMKRYTDSQGILLARRDTLVADEEVKAFAARDFYAPMVGNAQLDNLRYSYVANDNELYMNVNEPDYMVEKTNIYVTVKEVPDLQGNLMASPVTLNLFVYRNPLRWDVKRIEKDVYYGNGLTFEATVKNLSGVKQNFKLEDLPQWISASQTQGVLDALDEQKITFTVSDYINIGTYNEQIALIGDNTMSEPLPITLRVRGDEPEWTVPDRLKQQNQTMMMVARVKINGVVASSNEDILAVFDDKQQVLGVAHIEVNDNANANEALAYLTIYGYKNNDGSFPTLNFRFFDASAGNVYRVSPADSTTYRFEQDAIVGSDINPVIMVNNQDYVQTLKLKQGWNWVTFYVTPKKDATLGSFLNGLSKWEAGDKLLVVNGTNTADYYCRSYGDKNGNTYLKWDNEDESFTVDPRQMYSIYSKSDKTIYLEGEFTRRSITVHKDWNRVGYLSTINLPISQALADYLEQAQVGDVVKSQDGFAIASQTASGLVWKGSLQYLETGKGYMIKRQADNEVEFLYPLYIFDSRYSNTSESSAPRRAVSTATTMNIVAAVEGVETEAGDKLVVYSGAERLAEAVADEEQNYYLNIGCDDMDSGNLSFVIERDGETIAMTGSRITYAPNKVMGTPDEPTAINFTAIDQMPNDGRWYTVGGILIGEKPSQSGVYIHNGKAVLIK